MELALNLVWLGVAVTALVYNRNSSRRAMLAVICVLALLFPIISISDDLNPQALTDATAALVEIIVLMVAFVTIGRVRIPAQPALSVGVSVLSDPRSPPAR